jgi:hypothetical protein
LQLAMAPPSRNAKSFLKVEMVIRYTPNGFPYREPPTPKEKRTTSTGVGGAGRSLPFIAPPRSAAIPKKIASAAPWETGAARFTSRKVLDVVGEPHLRLIAGKGHWHFVYHDIKAGIYDTRSIYAMRLSDLSFGRGGARAFVAYVNTRWK